MTVRRTFLALFMVLFVSLYVVQCTDFFIPPIAQNLSGSFVEGEREFSKRVQIAYPVGTPVDEVIGNLEHQGFKINRRYGKIANGFGEKQDFATADFSRLIACGKREWSVRWFAKDGKVTRSFGVYGATCL